MANPLIALQAQGFNPLAIDAQVAQVKQAEQQNQLNMLKMGEYKRDIEQQNKLSSLLATGADAGALIRGGFLKQGIDLQKSNADVAKDTASTEKDKLATKIQKMSYLRQLIGSAVDPASYAQAVRAAQQGGFDVSDVPSQFDPNFVQNMNREALTQEQRLAQEWKAKGYDLDVRKQGEDERHNRTSEGLTASGQSLTRRGQDITMRGQDLTDDRARDLNANTKAAAAEAKKQSATEKSITDFSKVVQKEGIPELETALAGAEGALGRYKPGEVPGVGRMSGAVPAALLSEEGNDVRQAVATVRNIVLNARSGAAVTDQELRRMVEELGTGLGQSESALRRGLQKVRARLETIKANAAAGVNDEVLNTYRERGGIDIKRGGQSTTATTGGAFADPEKERRYQEFKARQGKQ